MMEGFSVTYCVVHRPPRAALPTMTDRPSESVDLTTPAPAATPLTTAAGASASALDTPSAAPAAEGEPGVAPPDAGAARPGNRRGRSHRGGQNAGRRDGSRPPGGPAKPATEPARPLRPVHPVLEQLAGLYPALFGEVFRPLKRGIYQDLLAAHPEGVDQEGLKEALALHTRSTRYLASVAAGMARHDLAGQPVEAMAPEHVHHALMEVYRRRLGRTPDNQKPALRERTVQAIVRAFDASGLSRMDYEAIARSRDESANALLGDALDLAAEQAAKDQAQLRAFEASGKTVEAFAEMYGLNPRDAAQTLARARRRHAAAAAAAVPVVPPESASETA
jgi:ProP effector